MCGTADPETRVQISVRALLQAWIILLQSNR